MKHKFFVKVYGEAYSTLSIYHRILLYEEWENKKNVNNQNKK